MKIKDVTPGLWKNLSKMKPEILDISKKITKLSFLLLLNMSWCLTREIQQTLILLPEFMEEDIQVEKYELILFELLIRSKRCSE